METSYSSKILDHLGLVAGMFDELGLGEVIDWACPSDSPERMISTSNSPGPGISGAGGGAYRLVVLPRHPAGRKPSHPSPAESSYRGNCWISTGQAIKAMIINGLEFVNKRLYLVSNFFADKPVERLLGPDIDAAQLNDDRLGRALDEVHEAGLTPSFSKIAVRALAA